MSRCLNDTDLQRFNERQLSPAEQAAATEHLAGCPECAARNARLRGTQDRDWSTLRDLNAFVASECPDHSDADATTKLATPVSGETIPTGLLDDSSANIGGSDLFPGYEIVREIGQGGQGAVYMAIQRNTKSRVAIKVLRDGVHSSETTRQRFEREIQISAQLREHPNIITVFDSGQTRDGRRFYVMDYVRGQPLNKYVRENHVALDDALRVISSICGALQFAHQRGIVHRDLKPSNILIDTEGKPRILDFGLAKALAGPSDALSVSQNIMGTLPYLAPEQTRGGAAITDARTDVYALGVVLYETLTGHFPYTVTDAVPSVLRRIAEEEPVSPRKAWESSSGVASPSSASGIRRRSLRGTVCPIDDEVETIVLKALAKERERRYQSAEELGRDIDRYLLGETIDARRDSLMYRMRVAVRKRKRAFVWGAVAAMVVAGALWTAWRTATTAASSTATAAAAAATANAAKIATAKAAKLTSEAAAILLNGAPDKEQILALDRILDDAQREDSNCADAYFVRGKLRVAEARSKPRANRADAINAALWNFGEANRLSGGLQFAATASTSAQSPPANGGHWLAVWSAVDLLGLSRQTGRMPELLNLLRHPGIVPAISDPNARLARSYEPTRIFDAMLLDKPPDDRPLPGARMNKDAVVKRLFRIPRDAKSPALNPFETRSPAPYVMELVYEPIYVFQADLTLIPNPALVERVDPPGDDETKPRYRIHLRSDARWKDGHSISAADVVFSWEFFARPASKGRIIVEAEDATTVRITHDARRDTAELDMQITLVPEHRLGAAVREAEKSEKPPKNRVEQFERAFKSTGAEHIGNGPFQLERDDGDRVVLTRWDGYVGKSPHIRQFEYLFSTDSSKRMDILASSEVAEAELTPDEFRWDFCGEDFYPKYSKLIYPRSAYDYICWNLVSRENSPIRDPDLRRAIAAAIDLDTLRRQAYDELVPPFGGLWKTPVHDSRNPFKSIPPGFRVAAANELLDKSWKQRDARGVRVNGSGQSLKLTLGFPAESPHLRRIAVCMSQYLEPLGFDIELVERPNRELLENGNSPKPEFDGVFKAVVTNEHPSFDAIRWKSGGERNDSGFSDANVDRAFDDAVQPGVDAAERYRSIEGIIIREQPYLFLWEKPALWAISKRLKGMTFSNVGPYQHYPGPRGWWVEE